MRRVRPRDFKPNVLAAIESVDGRIRWRLLAAQQRRLNRRCGPVLLLAGDLFLERPAPRERKPHERR